jgi:PAT family beta-lactamase induction signal transducer AmpG
MVGKSKSYKNSISRFLSMLLYDRVIAIFLLGFSVFSSYFIIFKNLDDIIEQTHLVYDQDTMVFLLPLIIYSLRFIFAPLIDRVQLPFLNSILGRRRSWIVCSQICSFIVILMLSIVNPEKYFSLFSLFVTILAIFTSINLILIDAIRIESGTKNLQPLLVAAFMLGYTLSNHTCDILFDAIDSYLGVYGHYDFRVWSIYFVSISIVSVIGIITTCYIKDPENDEDLNLLGYSKYDYYKTFILYVLSIVAFIFIYSFLYNQLFDSVKSNLILQGLSNSFINYLKNISSIVVALICMIIIFYFIDYLKLLPHNLCTSISTNFFTDFFIKFKESAMPLLLLVIIFRIPEITGDFISDSFFSVKHYNIEDISNLKYNIAPIVQLSGAFLAGFIALKIGMIKSLTYGAVSSLIGIILILLSGINLADTQYIFFFSTLHYLFFGFSYTIFIGMISVIVSRAYSATQFVLFYIASSIIAELINNYILSIINVHGEIETLFLLIIFSIVIIMLTNRVKNILMNMFAIKT